MANVARLYLFGGFRLLSAARRPIRVASRKGQALIAYLACAPAGTATREKLATLLWSESDSRRARQNLRQVLFALGRALGERDQGLLRLQGDKVTLRTGRLRIDVLEFERDLADRSHAALERASKRFTGDLLEGLSIDAPLFEDWLMIERARVRARTVASLSTVLARQREAGALDAAATTADRILEIDPCLEHAHRALMEIYLAKRMRTSALRQYQLCRAVLRRELSVGPDEATTAVYRACLESEAPDEGANSGDDPPAQVPGRDPISLGGGGSAPPLVGRRQALAALRDVRTETLHRGCRLVVVCGAPNSGTSRLVDEFARSLADADAAVWRMPARRAERSPPLLPWREYPETRRQAQATPSGGLREARVTWDGGGSGRAGWAAVSEHADWRHSFESVVLALRAGATEKPRVVVIEDLHEFDPESLRLLGYAVRRLGSLPMLFVATARADGGRPRYRLPPPLRDLERAGCVRCLHLDPLGRDGNDAPADGADGPATLPADRRGAVLEQELSAAQADLDRGARDAARAALRGILSQARRTGNAPRARSLAWRARLRLAEVAEADGAVSEALHRLQALARRADSYGTPGERVRLFYALSRLCCRAGRAGDGYGYAREALWAERKAGAGGVWLPAEHLLFRAHLLGGTHGRVADRLSAHVDLARRLGMPRDEVGAAEALAVLAAMGGRFETAARHFERALGAAEALADPRLVAGTLMIEGLVHCWAGDAPRAIAALDRAGDLASGAGDVIRAAVVAGHRGFALLEARRLDEAVASLRDAAGAARDLGLAIYLPVFGAWLAAAVAAVGDRAAAQGHARAAWRLATAANRPWARAVALRTLAGPLSEQSRAAARAARRIEDERRALGFDVETLRARTMTGARDAR